MSGFCTRRYSTRLCHAPIHSRQWILIGAFGREGCVRMPRINLKEGKGSSVVSYTRRDMNLKGLSSEGKPIFELGCDTPFTARTFVVNVVVCHPDHKIPFEGDLQDHVGV